MPHHKHLWVAYGLGKQTQKFYYKILRPLQTLKNCVFEKSRGREKLGTLTNPKSRLEFLLKKLILPCEAKLPSRSTWPLKIFQNLVTERSEVGGGAMVKDKLKLFSPRSGVYMYLILLINLFLLIYRSY